MWILKFNPVITTTILTVLICQTLKPLIILAFDKNLKASMLSSTGGMPSSHSAMVASLATSVAMLKGPESLEFAISLTLALIVIHDAMGIRRAAGNQAKVINEWSKVLSEIYENDEFKIVTLKTLLGHSFSQVFVGVFLGITLGYLFMSILM